MRMGDFLRTAFGLICFTAGILHSDPAGAERSFSLIGGGAVISESPYKGVGTKATPVPVLLLDHKGFYIRGIDLGYRFFQADKLTLGVLVSPRFMGYDPDDSDALSGMEERKRSWDAGVALDYRVPNSGGIVLGAKAMTDASGRHHGQTAAVSVSRKFSNRYVQLTPSAGVRFFSSPLIKYYYGVRSSEALASRPAYAPDRAVNYFGDVMLNVGIHPKWIVVTRVGIEFLDSEITKSPIVDKDQLVTGVVGLTRRF